MPSQRKKRMPPMPGPQSPLADVLTDFVMQQTKGDLTEARKVLVDALALVVHELSDDRPCVAVHEETCEMLDGRTAMLTVEMIDRGLCIQDLYKRLGVRPEDRS